jgi:hypothetical protein
MNIRTLAYYTSDFGITSFEIILVDKYVMPSKSDNPLHFSTDYKVPYQIKWLDKYDIDFKNGFTAVINYNNGGSFYIKPSLVDSIKLDIIWTHGFIGWFFCNDKLPRWATITIGFITFIIGFIIKLFTS